MDLANRSAAITRWTGAVPVSTWNEPQAQVIAALDEIVQVDVYELVIPFDDRSAGTRALPNRWSSYDIVLVKITTADGLSGWGESFAYGCRTAVVGSLVDMVTPLLVGERASDIGALMQRLQKKLHIFGRYGIAMFALSGVDIALWDRRAKSAGKSLSYLLGDAPRSNVAAYASLVHYGVPEVVEAMAREAVEAGFTSVKLHETTEEAIRAGREGVGPDIELSVDANCAWTVDEAIAMLPTFAQYDLAWIEEPIFPPEDFASLALLRQAGTTAVSIGENACTRFEFGKMMDAACATYPQPSVTKMGGITEMVAVFKEAARRDVHCKPHSPYFGPGYWATLQLLAVAPGEPLLEYMYVVPDSMTGVGTPEPVDGIVEIPRGPGIGFHPDPDVIEKYGRGHHQITRSGKD